MNINDLVLVKWEDSQGCPQGWVHITELPAAAQCSIIHSVGWVKDVNKEAVMLVPQFSYLGDELNCFMGYVNIPHSAILNIERLK